MGLFNSLGRVFGVDSMDIAPMGEHQSSYGNNLGLRPNVQGIGDAFRNHKATVEDRVGQILAPPTDLTDVDIDALHFANAEEKAMHDRVTTYQKVQGDRIERSTAEFQTKLGTVEAQERAAHQLQGRLISHIDTRATNAVEGSALEHRLAGRLAGFRGRTSSIQNLIQSAGL